MVEDTRGRFLRLIDLETGIELKLSSPSLATDNLEVEVDGSAADCDNAI